MAGASDYLETALLNHVLRNSSYTSPTTVYAALYTAAPTDAGGGTEIAAAGYARVAVTTGALPDPAATLAAPAAWTGGMPAIWLDSADT